MTPVIQFKRSGETFRVHTLNSGQHRPRRFRAIPTKKCNNRHIAPFHPDLTGPNRSYPDLKNVKTRLVLGPWSFFIGTFLELVEDPDPIGGTWSLELLLPTAPAPALDPLVNWCCLVLFGAVWC